MVDILSSVRLAAEKRRRYLRTRDEIRRMPLDVALDLGIFREDAERIARTAVYG